jgi:hypothetical protein
MYAEDFEYEPTLEELYRLYVINNSGEKLGYDYKSNKPLMNFCDWQWFKGEQI